MVGGVILFIYYKVGDKVRIKSLDWYNENKSKITGIIYGPVNFIECMSKHCGQVATIIEAVGDLYKISLDDGLDDWSGNMFEGLVEEETKSNIIEEAKTHRDNINDTYICPEGYIFKDENGNVINTTKIVLEKKGKRYPKTYEECCKILGVNPNNFLTTTDCYDGEVETIDYEIGLLSKFVSLWYLRICRDAYWKMTGEEMGLGKPWEPTMETVYCISRNDNVIKCSYRGGKSNILEFPTPEMRDAFYENFKELIEECKELL